MKLLLAVVNKDDSNTVQSQLTKNGFFITRLATTGGFLQSGNVTFLIGVDEDKVDRAIDLISKHSKRRRQMVSTTSSVDPGMNLNYPVEVSVGGATIFVLDIDRMEKV